MFPVQLSWFPKFFFLLPVSSNSCVQSAVLHSTGDTCSDSYTLCSRVEWFCTFSNFEDYSRLFDSLTLPVERKDYSNSVWEFCPSLCELCLSLCFYMRNMSLFLFLYVNYVSLCVSIRELCLFLCFYMLIMSLFVFLYENYVYLCVSICELCLSWCFYTVHIWGFNSSLCFYEWIMHLFESLCFYMRILPPFVLLYADYASFCASICRFCLLLCFYMQILPPFVLLYADSAPFCASVCRISAPV